MRRNVHTGGHFEIYYFAFFHAYLEIQVPMVENLAQSNVLHFRPGIGKNIVMHASPIAINDKLHHCVLSLCVLIIVFMLSLLVLLMVVLMMLLIF